MPKLYFSNNSNEAKRLSRLFKQNKLRRLYHGIYTDDFTESSTDVIKHHWMEILAYIVPRGILSFRTAIDLKPTSFQEESIIFVTSSYAKTIHLPGLMINIIKGNNYDYIEQILPNLARSNVPRALLENLSVIRYTKFKGIKTIGREGVEAYLAKEMRVYGETRLNQIRDEAKSIANRLGYNHEYDQLNQIIRALLSSHPKANYLKTKEGKAQAGRRPYDLARINLFEALTIYLKKCKFRRRTYPYNKISFNNISFFESYFSNISDPKV